MRALWTAASGMNAQQLNVDVISNNLSNVNTTGFKKERVEFKDLFYETMDRAYLLEDGGQPVNLQTGHGAVPSATLKSFEPGSYESTDNLLDFAIDGKGFFMVMDPRGNTLYSRDGSFKLGSAEEGHKLTTSEGFPVLDENGDEIIIDFDINKLLVREDGAICYNEDEETIDTGVKLGIVRFANRSGLENTGANMYRETPASGAPVADSDMEDTSLVRQGFLESSNVQIVEEMVRLIAAQRAYEVNSKAIQAADEMMGQANNLRR